MPALAQPSRDFRYPARTEVNWCMLSVILRVAAPARSAANTSDACRTVRRESITNTIPLPQRIARMLGVRSGKQLGNLREMRQARVRPLPIGTEKRPMALGCGRLQLTPAMRL